MYELCEELAPTPILQSGPDAVLGDRSSEAVPVQGAPAKEAGKNLLLSVSTLLLPLRFPITIQVPV